MNAFNASGYITALMASSSIENCTPVPLPDVGPNENFLFISYSHADYKQVYSDLALLYSAGVRFWYDRGLPAGSNWDDAVKGILNHPCCCGVIFFLSENLFMSASANKEIRFVCSGSASGGRAKNYFCVNLTDKQPSGILRNIMLMDSSILESCGLDMDRIAVLASAFSDRQTYLPYSAGDHTERLIEQISRQFDVISFSAVAQPGTVKHAYLERIPDSSRIPIDREAFYIGRLARKCNFTLDDRYVSSLHAAIYLTASGYALTDMNSSNGTFLNGRKVDRDAPVILKSGDVITIGQTELIFRLV